MLIIQLTWSMNCVNFLYSWYRIPTRHLFSEKQMYSRRAMRVFSVYTWRAGQQRSRHVLMLMLGDSQQLQQSAMNRQH